LQGLGGQPFGGAAAPARPVNARPGVIVVKQGKEPGRVFEIRNDRLTIGRSRDSDIFLEDLAVSRLHATVYRDDNGEYRVRDENSANGTTVNGQRITEHVLQEGDEIVLGQTVLAFARR
jgi:pSer/pThr/pTyr-binding forkhead associated (FHA) protein